MCGGGVLVVDKVVEGRFADLPGTGDGVVDLNTGRSGHYSGGDEEHYHSCPHSLHPSKEK